jgi:acetyl-CoA C-acetyltransferase
LSLASFDLKINKHHQGLTMALKKIDYARPVYIVDGCRTPFLKARGKPGPFKHTDLAINASRSLLEKMPFEPDALDEVIFGSAMPGSDEANISRIVALRLGCGDQVPAYTVHRNCASGMQSLDNAALSIADGRSDLILAGGIEAMSRAPLVFSDKMVTWLASWWGAKTFSDRLKVLSQIRPSYLAPVISLLNGLRDPVVGLSMGQTAEKIAYRFGITRHMMDEYSVQSHHRLHKAHENGDLSEIVPMFDSKGHLYDHDEGVRSDSSVEKLAKLRPAFDKPFGMVTPGNSSQITDGAASLVLASAEAVEKHNLPVLCKLITTQWAGLRPDEMGLGPAHAIAPLLRSRRLKVDAIDYWEINEAFAAQVLAVVEALKDTDYCKQHIGLGSAIGEIPMDRLNIHGGGVSLGHPVGASGARIVLHLAKVLQANKAKRGIASLCIGGGQGGAMLIEREAV